MSNDTHVREFLERMANEIDVPALDWRSPVKRARRHRLVTRSVVAVIVAAVVVGGSLGLRSITERGVPANTPHPSTHPSIPHMHNGSLGVDGWMNGVRSLTPAGAGQFIFKCRDTCTHVAADLSPDGTHLAFVTTCGPSCVTARNPYNGIHVVDLVRGTDRLVVPGNGVGEPAWSPDGTRIAYVKDFGQYQRRIFVMNADGSGQTPVTPFLVSDASNLSWSPDGSRIVYSSPVDRLFVSTLDGSAPLLLAVKGRYPTWSPDGSKIAYFAALGPATHACDIRETTPDGRNDFSLIGLATVSNRCDYGGSLEWSPDGTELAALVYQELAPRKGYTAVFVVNADGSSARSFTGWVAGWPWEGLIWRPVP